MFREVPVSPLSLCCHSRACGNGLPKPLDSGLRRNDGGLRSVIRQAWQRGYRDGNPACFLFVVIPAKAGIQEGGAVVLRSISASKCVAYWIVIPAPAGMDYLNHWIPAFAGMTEGLRSVIRQEWQRGYRDGNPACFLFVVMPACLRQADMTV